MHYSQLSDFEINKRVLKYLTGARPLGYPHNADGRSVGCVSNGEYLWYDYCNKPADAYPVIYNNGISIGIYGYGEWGAGTVNHTYIDGVNPLRAAMIVFLMKQDKS